MVSFNQTSHQVLQSSFQILWSGKSMRALEQEKEETL